MALRTVGVRLQADVSAYMSGMKRAGGATRDFVGSMDKAAKAGHLDAVADKAAVVGIGLVGMAGFAVKAAADFDKSMSAVSAATHASAGEMDQLRKAALQAGKDTQYSATGAADAITELSKAGVSTADVLNGGLKGALSLAAAGQLDVGEAAETAASAMTQFSLTGDKIPHVADLLAAAAGKAQGSVHDMGYALNQSGLVAAQFGLSIEDTTGALAEFASAGLIGSDAGTSFKTMLLAIANPSGATSRLMGELGISFYDAQGKFIGLSGVAEMLRQKLGKLTEQQRQQALGQIFGSDAIRAASIIYKDGAAGVEKWKTAVNDSGYAQETAAKLTDNLAGDVERLKGSLETMAIEAGSGANGGLRTLVKSVEGLVDIFGKMPPAVGSGITILAAVGGALALALAGFIKMRKGVASAVAELDNLGPGGERAGRALQATSKWAGIAAVSFAGLEIAGVVFDKLGNASVNVDKLTASLQDYATTGKLTEGVTENFGRNLDEFALVAQSADSATHGFWGSLNDVTSSVAGVSSVIDSLNESIYGTSFNDATDKMKGLDQSFTTFIGTQKDATRAGEIWNELLDKSGLGTEELAKLLPGAWKGLQDLQAKTQGVAGATKDAASKTGDLNSALEVGGGTQDAYKTKADSVSGVLRGETDALVALSSQLRKASDPAFAFIAAQEGMAKAQKEATKAVKEHGGKSAEAREADRKLTAAALDLQEAAGRAASTLDGKLDPAMRATLKAAGLTDRQIASVAKEFRGAKKDADRYAGKYEALVGAPGAKPAKAAIDKAYQSGKMFDGSYVARLSITGDKPVSARLDEMLVKQRALQTGLSVTASRASLQKDLDRNRRKGYHGGGRTAMVGEHEPAGMVHGKEFVFNARTVRRIDQQQPGFLDEVQATGQLPGYQNGGRVWPFRANVSKTKVPPWELVASKVAGDFGNWPRSPGAQRGDSGVWHKILALVKGSGIPYEFGNSYRPGDPLWHGSGRAIDFMGYNQDRLANFFLARQNQVLELIHRSDSRDYGITRGHYNAMPTQWPLHRNHLHVAMKNGGTINEPITGVGASGRTYSFGENYQPEKVIPNWQGGGAAGSGGGGGSTTTIHLSVALAAGANPREAGRQIAEQLGGYLKGGGSLWVKGKQVLP